MQPPKPAFRAVLLPIGRAIGLSLVLSTALIGCTKPAVKKAEKQKPQVIVTTPITDQVADYEDFTGRLDGYRTVEIRARTSGYIDKAPFKEGDQVHKDDVLFLIDPRPYEADYKLAASNVKLAEADQWLQEKVANRARSLGRSQSTSQEDVETAAATFEKSKANVGATQATRDRAKLYVDYTKVLAPISGRISRRFVDPGNLVTQDSTLLTTVVQDDKLYAYFDVDERTYLNLIARQTPGFSVNQSELRFPVLFRLANEEEYTRSGIVDFVDNRVNAGTGTIRMRAEIDNAGGMLRAGLFVRIRLPIGAPYKALLIPDEAVMNDQGRKNIFVVSDKNVIEYRTVTLGQEIKGLRVIKQGVELGDKVVISGMQRVRAADEVTVEVQKPPEAPESPLGKLMASFSKTPMPIPAKDKTTPPSATEEKLTPADKNAAKVQQPGS